MNDQPTNTDILITLARVETKMDAFATGQLDHETRLRLIEDTLSTLKGRLGKAIPVGLSVGSVGVGGAIAAIWKAFGLG